MQYSTGRPIFKKTLRTLYIVVHFFYPNQRSIEMIPAWGKVEISNGDHRKIKIPNFCQTGHHHKFDNVPPLEITRVPERWLRPESDLLKKVFP